MNRDRRMSPLLQPTELFVKGVPSYEEEDMSTIESVRKNWTLLSSENGITIYQTPEGRFAETVDEHGKIRLTRQISKRERREIETAWPKA